MENFSRKLIIGPAWIGDMVMAQSLLMLLKHEQPNVELDVIVPAWCQPLLTRMPEVRQSLVSPFKHGELNLTKRYQLGKQLRSNHYDHAIVLPNSFKSALLPYFANIPKRTGWLGESRYGLLNDARRLNKPKYPIMVQRYAALAYPPHAKLPQQVPRPCLQVPEEDLLNSLAKHQLIANGKPILALCPGAEFGPSKRWPKTHYAKVAATQLKAGWAVWLFGSVKDKVLTDQINQATGDLCVNLAGATTLLEAVDLLSQAKVVISNDSGLMHIAAALNRPLIALYGSTPKDFMPPLSDRAMVLSLNLSCQPCIKRQCPLGHLRCLKDLKPAMVLAALEKLVAEENIND